MRCAGKVQYAYVDNQDDFRSKIAFAKTESGRKVAGSMGSIVSMVQNLITFCSMLVVLARVSMWIVIVLLVTTLPAVILANLQKDEEYVHKTKWMKEGALVIHQFQECCAPYSLNEVRFLGLFDFLKRKWRNTADRYIVIKNKMTKKHVAFNLLADFLRSCVYIFLLLIVAGQIFETPGAQLGTFTLVISIAGEFQTHTTKLFVGMTQFFSDVKYMQDFFELTELKQEEDEKEEPIEDSTIEYEHVDFTYSGTDKPALQDICVRIRKGEKVAIVGENGSGKTTFVNLLLGLYEQEQGCVRIGGRKIQEHLSECRRNISAIFQNFARYEMEILGNITISDRDKRVDEEAILELAQKTGAYSFIEKQPGGLHEVVGSLSDKGNNLSGGEWQRIAITRAAYRDNAKIMILDEPTAALDPIAEADLYQRFAELTKDKTTIFISHRLGISKIVDRILVFDEGRIVEDGSHAELMRKNGLYARMYHAQAQWYNT